MKVKNIIISVFFLFVYSFSFAHALTPHINGFYAEHQPEFHSEEITEYHHAHEHTHTENGIVHDNHFDKSFLDLIICLFSDFHHHHSNDSDSVLPGQYPDQKEATGNVDGYPALMEENQQPLFLQSNIIRIPERNNSYASQYLKSSFQRGPPTLS
ncbi:MAG: hypothetical protein ACWA41_12175 [Putridiphycobacter sp.]